MKDALYIGSALAITYLIYKLSSGQASDIAAQVGNAAAQAVADIQANLPYNPASVPVAPPVSTMPVLPADTSNVDPAVVLTTINNAIATGDVSTLDPVQVRQQVTQAVNQLVAPPAVVPSSSPRASAYTLSVLPTPAPPPPGNNNMRIPAASFISGFCMR